MNYLTETRRFIDELVEMQQYMRDVLHYKHENQSYIDKVLKEITDYFKNFKVDSNRKMWVFWMENFRKVKVLLPSVKHPGFANMLRRFEEIDDYTKNTTWILTQNLN